MIRQVDFKPIHLLHSATRMFLFGTDYQKGDSNPYDSSCNSGALKDNSIEERKKMREFNPLEIRKMIDDWSILPQNVSQDFGLDTLARAIHVPSVMLQDFFDRHMNVSFRTWKLNRKIEVAKGMLLTEELIQIAEVARRVGFPDKSNFYRQFKRIVGCTPREWRECQGNLNLIPPSQESGGGDN